MVPKSEGGKSISQLDQARIAVRGVVEGFYGTFYTFPQRDDLLRFLGRHGFNTYLYGPKNDRQHRMRWFEPYPESVLDDFGRTIATAEREGITFSYAISFGVPVRYGSARDFKIVSQKLGAFIERGCRSFGVFFDDLTNAFSGDENRRTFRTAGEAQSTFCNELFAWVRARGANGPFFVCPTDYWGRPPFNECVLELGERLAPEIDVLYTGPEVCSRTITRPDVRAFEKAVGRKPVLWDNYPVNDTGMRGEMHVGPLRGRDPRLADSVRGLLANPMNQPEASKIALSTIAEYLASPGSYRAEKSWRRALREIGGEDGVDALSLFAENLLKSPLLPDGPSRLDLLVEAVLECDPVSPGALTTVVRRLSRYLDRLDEGGYRLKNRIGNLALRQDLLPWIEALEHRVWLGRAAIALIDGSDHETDQAPSLRSLRGLLEQDEGGQLTVGGSKIRVLARRALEHAQMRESGSPGGSGLESEASDQAANSAQESS